MNTDAIKEDIKWLGFDWKNELYASDYFEQLYQYAITLIKKGLAYVDDLTAEEIAKLKEAKEKATEFAGEAKEKASEFAEDAKEVLNDGGGKGIAIISHLWWIGWIIALIMNNSNKTELGSFYIRQTLGICLLSFFYI